MTDQTRTAEFVWNYLRPHMLHDFECEITPEGRTIITVHDGRRDGPLHLGVAPFSQADTPQDRASRALWHTRAAGVASGKNVSKTMGLMPIVG